MSQKLIQAQEEERASIARELHDDINQRIAFASVTLEGLKEDRTASEALKEGLAEEFLVFDKLDQQARYGSKTDVPVVRPGDNK